MIKIPGREFIKTLMMRRLGIERVELDRLICRHGMVTMRTPKADLIELMNQLAPVDCKDRPLIRMGAPKDGGYLVPDDLDGLSACFSPGIEYISKFEKECADRGMKVFMADKSVSKPAEDDPAFHFIQKHIGAIESDEFMTMDGWVRTLHNGTSDLLLQMDIEGAEYAALLGLSDELLKRFRIIVCEFHLLDHLWSKPFFGVAADMFRKILETHRCVHIHPNNCSAVLRRDELAIPSIMEFTFLRKDRISSWVPARRFPHPLDADCTPRSTLILPACWQGGEV